MAAQEEKVLVKADLDAAGLISEAMKAKKALGEMVDTESFKEVVANFKHAGIALGIVGAAAFAAKASLDFTLEAESIKKINAQFEHLTKAAGIATKDLEEGLKKVSEGLVDDTDLIQAANKAIIGMGASAKELPRIFELARKATSIMGGDLLQNFQTINQALAMGQVRTLRQFQITVDAAQAQAKFARELGITVGALTEAEKRQAIMNAALESGEKRFKDVKVSAESATAQLQKIKASFNDLGETIAIFVERIVGDKVRAALKTVNGFIGTTTNDLKRLFGNAEESAEASMKQIQKLIDQEHKEVQRIAALEETAFFGLIKRNKDAMMREHFDKILRYDQELRKHQEVIDKKVAAEKQASEELESHKEKVEELSPEQKINRLLAEAKMIQMRSGAEMAAIRAQMEVEGSAAEMKRLYHDQEMVMQEQKAGKLKEIQAQEKLGQIDAATAAQLRLQLETQVTAEISALKIKAMNAELEAAENLAKVQRKGLAGFEAGARAAAKSATQDFGNMAALGKRSFDAFGDAAAKSLMKLGDGSANAAEAMGGFFLGALGDIAEAQGRLMLLSAIFPPNPAAAAGGAALLVLAGFLKSKAGAAGGGGAGATAGGEAGGGGLSLSGPDEAGLREAEKKQIKREVTIQIQGHYLDTEGSRRELMNMIRQESDATDFKYVQIGQGA